MNFCRAAGFCLVLSACVSATVTCPTNKKWTDNEQNRMYREVNALPDNDILITVINDYKRMRIEAAQCQSR